MSRKTDVVALIRQRVNNFVDAKDQLAALIDEGQTRRWWGENATDETRISDQAVANTGNDDPDEQLTAAELIAGITVLKTLFAAVDPESADAILRLRV